MTAPDPCGVAISAAALPPAALRELRAACRWIYYRHYGGGKWRLVANGKKPGSDEFQKRQAILLGNGYSLVLGTGENGKE